MTKSSQRRRLVAVASAIALLGLSGCSDAGSGTSGAGSGAAAGSSASGTAGQTLRAAISFDPGSLDPDIFYGNEGLVMTTACYDGLLAYRPDTATIQPALATAYQVSDGGRRYSFTLRSGVRFADGTPFDAQAMKSSLLRRKAVDGGSAYMVEPIRRISTPSPTRLVIDLKRVVEPFPSWLASPYGPKAVSPTLVAAHERDGDEGQKWMATHCAGTGPYDLTSVTPGQSYELTANDRYWGRQPSFRTVDIRLIPDFATQQLELRNGGLDLMTHGIPAANLTSFAKDPGFSVTRLPGISAVNLWINLHKPNLQSVTVRRAIGLALDRPKLVEQVYGADNATTYDGVFAPGTLPASLGADYALPYDPAQAKAIVSSVPASKRSISLVYTSDDTSNQQLAGLIGQQLTAVGFRVDLRDTPETEVFNYASSPEQDRPAMIVLPQNPDDASPSSFPQLQWLSTEPAGGFFHPFDPAADQVFARATSATSSAAALPLYAEAAKMYRDTNSFVPIANTRTVIVARKGISGFSVERQGLWTVRFADLRQG